MKVTPRQFRIMQVGPKQFSAEERVETTRRDWLFRRRIEVRWRRLGWDAEFVEYGALLRSEKDARARIDERQEVLAREGEFPKLIDTIDWDGVWTPEPVVAGNFGRSLR